MGELSSRVDQQIALQTRISFQTGTGILVYQRMRNKYIIDYLHHLSLSVDYTCIETQLTERITRCTVEHDAYVLPSLIKNELIFYAADNSDFSEDTPQSKCNLHGTAIEW